MMISQKASRMLLMMVRISDPRADRKRKREREGEKNDRRDKPIDAITTFHFESWHFATRENENLHSAG